MNGAGRLWCKGGRVEPECMRHGSVRNINSPRRSLFLVLLDHQFLKVFGILADTRRVVSRGWKY